MIDLTNFDWGWMDEPSDMVHIHIDGSEQDMGQYHKQSIIEEINDPTYKMVTPEGFDKFVQDGWQSILINSMRQYFRVCCELFPRFITHFA